MTEYAPRRVDVYELARMAAVDDPDSPHSAGAEWLKRVADITTGLVEYSSIRGFVIDDAEIEKLVDFIVPSVPHTLWSVFVDLGLYRDVDPTDPSIHQLPLETETVVARRLMHALLDAWRVRGAEEVTA